MIKFTTGNLLEANVEAVVNTVNTVGVMGKGIALMFKEHFPENFKAYEHACKAAEIQIGKMFIQPTNELSGLQWVINFPTKKHWRSKTKISWIESGLKALKSTIIEHNISSIAIPPLGCGNGGLEWSLVRPLIMNELQDLYEVDIVVYEPTSKYQNVAKPKGLEKLTPARALVAELVRRYWVMGNECSILEIQKISWFLERYINKLGLENPLDLGFNANRYGPYANRLIHLLNGLDGSYLHCNKRLADASYRDIIWFDESRREHIWIYLNTQEAKCFIPALEATDTLIDGFQSALCIEALSTVDWLLLNEGAEPNLNSIKDGISRWAGGGDAARRKQMVFNDNLLNQALKRLEKTLYT